MKQQVLESKHKLPRFYIALHENGLYRISPQCQGVYCPNFDLHLFCSDCMIWGICYLSEDICLEVYFFLILFYFKTLQYCIGFAIYQNESATGIHVFPILNPPPSSLPYHHSGSSQCTSPKHPVLCIKPGLVTHSIYDIIRISVPFSQIIPPSPSPTESKRLFYTSVSLLLSRPPDLPLEKFVCRSGSNI